MPERFLNNGQPSGLAMWFEALDLNAMNGSCIGCGTGYYTAILANVGPKGRCVSSRLTPN